MTMYTKHLIVLSVVLFGCVTKPPAQPAPPPPQERKEHVEPMALPDGRLCDPEKVRAGIPLEEACQLPPP